MAETNALVNTISLVNDSLKRGDLMPPGSEFYYPGLSKFSLPAAILHMAGVSTTELIQAYNVRRTCGITRPAYEEFTIGDSKFAQLAFIHNLNAYLMADITRIWTNPNKPEIQALRFCSWSYALQSYLYNLELYINKWANERKQPQMELV